MNWIQKAFGFPRFSDRHVSLEDDQIEALNTLKQHYDTKRLIADIEDEILYDIYRKCLGKKVVVYVSDSGNYEITVKKQ